MAAKLPNFTVISILAKIWKKMHTFPKEFFLWNLAHKYRRLWIHLNFKKIVIFICGILAFRGKTFFPHTKMLIYAYENNGVDYIFFIKRSVSTGVTIPVKKKKKIDTIVGLAKYAKNSGGVPWNPPPPALTC